MNKYIFLIIFLILIVPFSGLSQEVIDPEIFTRMVYFSFASDDYHNGPTFYGEQNVIYTEGPIVDLMVDLNNDFLGGLVTYQSYFRLKAELRDHKVISLGYQWLHIWKVYAEFYFYHVNPLKPANSNLILSVAFKEGVLTSYSSSPFLIGETMTLENSENADPSIYFQAYPILNGVNLGPLYLKRSEDLAFTFTNVHATNPESINNYHQVIVNDKGIFETKWQAEGSFSASALPVKINDDGSIIE